MNNTLEQLQALPDDQLIEKVAVEVMGWKKRRLTDEEGNWGGEYKWVDPIAHYDHGPVGKSYGWNPLTDWNHTMDVWKRLEKLGFEPGIYKRGKLYRAHAQVAGQHWHDDENPQRSLCIAAILSVPQ